MNYQKLYTQIVEKAKSEQRTKGGGTYFEEHHILPRCLYPEYQNLKKFPWNGVLLTAREHFLCHWLLAKTYPDNFNLQCAWNAFSLDTNGLRQTSKLYEYARLNFIRALKANEDRKTKTAKTVAQMKWINKEGVCTRVHKDIAEQMVSDEGWQYGRIYFQRPSPTEETRAKMSEARVEYFKTNYSYWKGKKVPAEAHARGVETRKRNGSYKWTEEQRRRASQSKKKPMK